MPLLERPLTLGFVWGLCTGNWAQSLGVSLFFELLWLDIFPAGTVIPPNPLAPVLASLAAVSYFGVTKPVLAALIMLLALPLGGIFAWIERWHRHYENDAHTRLMRWAKSPEHALGPVQLVRRSALLLFCVNMAAFAVVLACLMALTHILLPRVAPFIQDIPLKWPHLWGVAGIGAVLSLRYRPAYAVLLLGAGLTLVGRLLAW